MINTNFLLKCFLGNIKEDTEILFFSFFAFAYIELLALSLEFLGGIHFKFDILMLNFLLSPFLSMHFSDLSFVCFLNLQYLVKLSPLWLNIKHLPILLWAVEINSDQVLLLQLNPLMCCDSELESRSCQPSAGLKNAIRTIFNAVKGLHPTKAVWFKPCWES